MAAPPSGPGRRPTVTRLSDRPTAQPATLIPADPSRLDGRCRSSLPAGGHRSLASRVGAPTSRPCRADTKLVSLATNSPPISAPRRPLAAFLSSPLAPLAASSSALRCIHLATNLGTEFLTRPTSDRAIDKGGPRRGWVPGASVTVEQRPPWLRSVR